MIESHFRFKLRFYFKSGRYKILFFSFLFFQTINVCTAQHDMPGMKMTADTMKMAQDNMSMTSSFSLRLPMNRDGSGTSWQPDESPMMMYMVMKENTSMVFHGSLFLRYTSQDMNHFSKREDDHLDAPNMFMFMLSRKINDRNLFSFYSMLSLDPLTVGRAGYPLLFQTGESYKGVPLVDRQHPHDLFSELAVSYTCSLSKDMDVNTYFGYPGEPALGPVAFMHRVSAMNDPDAPLSHHWQDATHIAFGVGTLGLRYKNVKAEGSIFTGREPDENRYNFDKPRLDSYSYRIHFNPNRSFSFQFSEGFIKSPEALFPEEDITRTTASVLHTKILNHENFIATALVWGMNHSSHGENLNSVLLESNLKLVPLTLYTRYEFIQKDAHELQLLQFTGSPVFNIHAITLGLNRILFTELKTDLSAGIQGTINFPGKKLKSIYGNNPLSAEVYLKVAPGSGNIHHQ